MSRSSAQQMRSWQGPALLSFGFRPFFLLGAVWAALAMLLWALALAGLLDLPTRLGLVSWHAHAFLFGYVGAIIAGFLLTAVPNWTGRLPVVGWRLGALAALWVLGRIAVLASVFLPPWVAPVVDLAFPLALGALILREIVAGRNWRNLPVLGLLAVFAGANLAFHLDALSGGYAAQGTGLRLGLASVIGMITLIGGRIVPSFTRNWLVQRGETRLPAPPMRRFDKITLLLSLPALLAWVAWPQDPVTATLLLLFAALHAVRLARWQGLRTRAEPLVWVLHLGYGFVPLGALALGLATLWPGLVSPAAAQHVWMAGALGLMTLAVMTRATLGHTGHALTACPMTVVIYVALTVSVLARLFAAALPGQLGHDIAALAWILAFAVFSVIYGPRLLTRKQPAPA